MLVSFFQPRIAAPLLGPGCSLGDRETVFVSNPVRRPLPAFFWGAFLQSSFFFLKFFSCARAGRRVGPFAGFGHVSGLSPACCFFFFPVEPTPCYYKLPPTSHHSLCPPSFQVFSNSANRGVFTLGGPVLSNSGTPRQFPLLVSVTKRHSVDDETPRNRRCPLLSAGFWSDPQAAF